MTEGRERGDRVREGRIEDASGAEPGKTRVMGMRRRAEVVWESICEYRSDGPSPAFSVHQCGTLGPGSLLKPQFLHL